MSINSTRLQGVLGLLASAIEILDELDDSYEVEIQIIAAVRGKLRNELDNEQ